MKKGITFIYGEMGSGKTLLGAWRAYLAYSRDKEIYTNVKSLRIPHTYVDLWELLDEAEKPKWDTLKKKWFLLDEIQTIADGYAPPSNSYIRKLRILFSQFRKRHAKLDFVSQFPTGAHFSLRTLTNCIIACDAHYPPDNDEDEPPTRIDYYWQDIKRTRLGHIPHGNFYFDQRDLHELFQLNLYDTFEVIESPVTS